MADSNLKRKITLPLRACCKLIREQAQITKENNAQARQTILTQCV